MRKNFIIAAYSFIALVITMSGAYAILVIHGTDHRQDIFQITDGKILNNASVTVMLIDTSFDTSNITDGAERVLETHVFGDRFQKAGSKYYPICPDERYLSQRAASFVCSGVFVDSDIVLTAGHCLDKASSLPIASRLAFVKTNLHVIRNFRQEIGGNTRTVFQEDEIYGVIDYATGGNAVPTDWAYLRLDHKFAAATFPRMRAFGAPAASPGTPIYILGHPNGLPLKFANNAYVQSSPLKDTFSAELDAFSGNSGSPIFNNSTHDLEGILHGGSADWYVDSTNSCVRSNCGSCAGETVQATTGIPDWKNVVWQSQSH